MAIYFDLNPWIPYNTWNCKFKSEENNILVSERAWLNNNNHISIAKFNWLNGNKAFLWSLTFCSILNPIKVIVCVIWMHAGKISRTIDKFIQCLMQLVRLSYRFNILEKHQIDKCTLHIALQIGNEIEILEFLWVQIDWNQFHSKIKLKFIMILWWHFQVYRNINSGHFKSLLHHICCNQTKFQHDSLFPLSIHVELIVVFQGENICKTFGNQNRCSKSNKYYKLEFLNISSRNRWF